jgi:hypothetical protein
VVPGTQIIGTAEGQVVYRRGWLHQPVLSSVCVGKALERNRGYVLPVFPRSLLPALLVQAIYDIRYHMGYIGMFLERESRGLASVERQ